MNRAQAEKEVAKYLFWNNKKLFHREYRKRMTVLEIGVAETSPDSGEFFVYCRLEGDLGEVTETIEYVSNNYVVGDGDLHDSTSYRSIIP